MRLTHTDETVSPPEEPAATPLFSAADIAVEDYPIVHIPERRVHPIESHAEQIADHSPGPVEKHQTGKVGEYAVAKRLGVQDEIDFQVCTDGGDGGFDLIYNGIKIDVKTLSRSRADPDLMVNRYQPLRADYYLLASRVSKTDVRLIGVAPRKFVADAPLFNHNGSTYHHVEQEYVETFPASLM